MKVFAFDFHVKHLTRQIINANLQIEKLYFVHLNTASLIIAGSRINFM